MENISKAHHLLFTVEEVAGLFRLTQAAVRRMIRVKDLPAIRIGKEYRIPSQVIENILHPLNEPHIKDAGFGMWKSKKNLEGSQWVKKHRQEDSRSLEELLKDLQSL